MLQKLQVENIAKLLLIKNLLQLPGSLFPGHETYDDLGGLESRNVGHDFRNRNHFNENDGIGYRSGETNYFGSSDGNQYYVLGIPTTDAGSSSITGTKDPFGLFCVNGSLNEIHGNNMILGGFRATKNGNTYTVSSIGWAASGYKEIHFGAGNWLYGRTETTNHIIGGLKSCWGNLFGGFWGTNTFHGEICPGNGGEISNNGAFILAGNGYSLDVDEYKIRNLSAGSLTYSSSWFTNYVLVGESDSSVLGGRCIGGGYTEIDGGTLKVTSPGYFEARCEGNATQSIPAGKYAWPLRFKNGTCDVGISTSGGKVRTLFGGAAAGRQITDMGRLVAHVTLAASSGKNEDLQSYWVDKGPYGGWYLFDPDYWS